MRAHRLRLSSAWAIASTVTLLSTTGHAQQADTTGRAPSTTTETSTAAARTDKPTPLVEPPAEAQGKSTDIFEQKGKTYYFLGVRYRGTIIPKFVIDIFFKHGRTFYSNTVGAEFEYRKDAFSIIPNLTFSEYGTGGEVLVLEKGKPDSAQNWAIIDSSIKVISANVDLLWSTKMHKNVEFEGGVGFGIMTIAGSLVNNWVYEKADGPYEDPDRAGRRFAKCMSTTDADSCKPAAHSNSDVAKVGNYEEPSWINGGSKFNFFLHLAPQLGLRIKPVKEFVGRIGVGVSLTGFFFGLSGSYGLEKALEKKTDKP